MGLEVLAAALVGLAAVWLVLQPLLLPGRARPAVYEPPDPEETPKGVALAALKEIEFDRETGKLSDEDYAFLKSKYTGVALDALRVESADAAEVRAQEVRTSSERQDGSGDCAGCGAELGQGSRFCEQCGTGVAA